MNYWLTLTVICFNCLARVFGSLQSTVRTEGQIWHTTALQKQFMKGDRLMFLIMET
jgi:hypothetical protein